MICLFRCSNCFSKRGILPKNTLTFWSFSIFKQKSLRNNLCVISHESDTCKFFLHSRYTQVVHYGIFELLITLWKTQVPEILKSFLENPIVKRIFLPLKAPSACNQGLPPSVFQLLQKVISHMISYSIANFLPPYPKTDKPRLLTSHNVISEDLLPFSKSRYSKTLKLIFSFNGTFRIVAGHFSHLFVNLIPWTSKLIGQIGQKYY